MHSHSKWDNSVKSSASKYLFISSYRTIRISIRCHNKASFLIVFFMFIQNAIKMWKLPRKDVCDQIQGCWIQKCPCLCKSANKRWQSSDYSTSKGIIFGLLFHRQVNTQIAEPNCIRNDPCKRMKHVESHQT
jgi:hypothetical protein